MNFDSAKIYKRIIIAGAFLLLFFIPARLSAVEASLTLKGKITDSRNIPIPSVRIVILELKRQVFTDSKGNYIFPKINKGKYHINFGRIGFKEQDTIIEIDKNKIFNIRLEESDIITDNVVVTGTRTYKYIENLPMPVEVVTQSKIMEQGYLRLDKVLSQEMGIPMEENRGRGMQVQGLDADYSLILLNGEPMTGRTGGVLDISKLSIGDVSRIEVVRGPSSSLYGSSALAGVINLITEKPHNPLDLSLSSKYASHNTYDVSGELRSNFINKKIGLRLFADNYRTEGFSLIKSVVEQTVPQNDNWTLDGELFYDITPTVKTRLNARHFSEAVENKYQIFQSNDTNLINTTVNNRENNFSFKADHILSNHYDLEIRLYGSDYYTETNDVYDASGEIYNNYQFRNRVGKAEIQSTSLLGAHKLMSGFGAQFDQVQSNQIENGKQNNQLYFGYLQDDWQLSEKVSAIASLRYDGHSDYKDNLSPKIAATWQIIPDLFLRASLGSGFKAPTFEELYLNWSLPSEGYSVFGIKNFFNEFRKLSETGQIKDTLFNLSEINDLSPEKSWALDLGGTYSFNDLFEIKLNMFRNNVNNLIDFLPVAVKNNGKFVYTYFNLNRIYTQGLETRLRLKPWNFLSIQLHYQLLFTADINVVNTLNEPNQKQYWKRDGYNDRPVRPDEYGGLFNRSQNSGSVVLNFTIPDWDFLISVNGVFKSKYGYADVNGNTILDDELEYAPGYSFWYLMASKKFLQYFTLQLGIDNVFDYKSEKIRLVTSGRTFSARLIFNYNIE